MSRTTPPLAAAALLLAGCALLPAGAPAQDTTLVRDTAAAPDTAAGPASAPFLGRSYAVVAYDSAAGLLGLAAASTEFSVGSGGVQLEPGVGAVAALGSGGGSGGGDAPRGILAALRSERSPAAALRAASGPGAPAHAAALTPACDRDTRRAPWAADDAVSRPGRLAGLCYVAAGLSLRDSAELDRAVGALRSSSGSLAERLVAALSAAEGVVPEVGGSRSAVLWIAGDDTSAAPGGRELRLQVDDHGRAALALEKRLEAARADRLAALAGRAVDRGDHQRAAALADSALALDVSATTAWLQRGRALLHRGREEEAETAFQRMLELDPYLLRLLGDASGSQVSVRESVIPYYPRLVLRLDLYRREYFDDLDFGPEPEPFGRDTAR